MFFKEIADLAKGMSLTVRINEKDGQLTVSVLPDNVENIQPLVASGTPEEMDAGLIEAIRQPLYDAKTLLKNGKEFVDTVSQKVKADIESADKSKKPATVKKAAPITKVTAKAEMRESEEEDSDETADEGPKQLTIE